MSILTGWRSSGLVLQIIFDAVFVTAAVFTQSGAPADTGISCRFD